MLFLLIVGVTFAITAGVATLFNGITGPQSQPAPSPSVSIVEETQEPVASEDVQLDDHDEDMSCLAMLGASEYNALSTRILDYEEARLQPGFNADQDIRRIFVTDSYISSHTGSIDESAKFSDVAVALNRETSIVNCNVLSESRIIVQSENVITTFQTDSSGNRQVVNEFSMPRPAHTTEWVFQDGDWYVDSERR